MVKASITVLSLPYPATGEKTVRVYVPEHEEGELLPVIYMTDGQNLFEEELSAFGCWFTREAVSAERKAAGKAAVIVGIHNDEGPEVRTSDLTPVSIGDLIIPPDIPEAVDPRGEMFDRFVTDTVMPAVQSRFPVLKGRNATAFCGSSMGGLMALYTALTHPDLYCASGVFSPALIMYDRGDMDRWIYSSLEPCMPYLYMYCGMGDELERTLYPAMDAAYSTLEECYPPEKLSAVILPEEPHHETAWEQVFRDFLHTFLTRREEF